MTAPLSASTPCRELLPGMWTSAWLPATSAACNCLLAACSNRPAHPALLQVCMSLCTEGVRAFAAHSVHPMTEMQVKRQLVPACVSGELTPVYAMIWYSWACLATDGVFSGVRLSILYKSRLAAGTKRKSEAGANTTSPAAQLAAHSSPHAAEQQMLSQGSRVAKRQRQPPNVAFGTNIPKQARTAGGQENRQPTEQQDAEQHLQQPAKWRQIRHGLPAVSRQHLLCLVCL